ADHGYSATSTREISERLGFTKAALYYHFRTKEDLLAAIVAPAMEDLSALAARCGCASTASDRRHLVEGYVDLVARHVDLIGVLANDPAARISGVLVAAQPLYQRLAIGLSGTDAPDLEQRVKVRCALGAIHLAYLRAERDEDREVVRRTAVAAACGVLGFGSPRGAREPVR
ncbi:MAG: TetR/AcrR family transcriptional regulator, partial [Acidimicrobiales bacterium]